MDIAQIRPKDKIAAAAPYYELLENDQTFPAGMYRIIATGDTLDFQRATATDWSTVTSLLTLDGGNSLVTMGVQQNLGDDVFMQSGGVAKFGWDTSDANANMQKLGLPAGGAVDVPIFAIGLSTGIIGVDNAVGNGIVEPTLLLWNAAGDAYISFDAGDDGVASAKGIYFKAAADEDIELINLSVTGTPRWYWDESANCFRSTVGLISDALSFINDDANTKMTIGLTINQGANDDEIFALKSSDVAHAYTNIIEADTFFMIKKVTPDDGGAQIWGLKDSAAGNTMSLQFLGVLSGNADTTKSTAGRSILELSGFQASGGVEANIVADGNVFGIRTYKGGAYSTLMIVDEDGDLWLQGGLSVGSGALVEGQGTGANGLIIKNPKNAAASGLSGTQLDVEIDIGGTPYYFTVYPTKA